MKLVIKRTFYQANCIIGRVEILNSKGISVFKCYSIELPWLNNEQTKSCIPSGVYKCVSHQSSKYVWSWEVLNVKNRSAILIHVANKPTDIKGCIGLGKQAMLYPDFSSGFISDSLVAIKQVREIVGDSFDLEIIS